MSTVNLLSTTTTCCDCEDCPGLYSQTKSHNEWRVSDCRNQTEPSHVKCAFNSSKGELSFFFARNSADRREKMGVVVWEKHKQKETVQEKKLARFFAGTCPPLVFRKKKNTKRLASS